MLRLYRCLDECLLTGAEMELGPRAWQRDWYDSVDKIRLPTKLYVDDRDDNVIKVIELSTKFRESFYNIW